MKKPILKYSNVLSINPLIFTKLSKKVLFIDGDNTLFLPKVPISLQDMKPITNWLREVAQSVDEIVLISNNFSQDKQDFCQSCNLKYIFFAKKPLPWSFNKAKKLLVKDYQKEDIIHIGDQVLTDAVGASWFEIDYILVNPIDEKHDLIFALPSRIIERMLNLEALYEEQNFIE